jgi:hypothetical protein
MQVAGGRGLSQNDQDGEGERERTERRSHVDIG